MKVTDINIANDNSSVKHIANIADLQPDPQNANRGTHRGRGMLAKSLRDYGAGRSILADRNGIVIAGNKTLGVAAEIGLPVRVIETDGSELVVVQRTDIDLNDGTVARELAYADNRVGEVSLEFDAVQIASDMAAGVNLTGLWTEEEIQGLIQDTPDVSSLTGLTQPKDTVAPESFREYGEDLETAYKCPKCAYEWSGKPK